MRAVRLSLRPKGRLSLDGLNPIVTESLAGDAFRKLMSRMHVNRIRRLEASGFDTHSAQHLSELHTPNLM